MKGEAGVVAVFNKKILAGQNPVINGDGKQTRDYVFVGDVVRANLLAQRYSGSGKFNICTEKETSVNKLFRLINKNLNNRAKKIHGPEIHGEQVRSVLSNKLAGKTLRWKPVIGIEEGIEKTCGWFMEYYERD